MSLLVEELPRTGLVRDALRRRWLLVVASAVVVATMVGGLALHATPKYVASASVFLQPITGNALSPDATVNGQQVTVAMETEAGLVDSPAVVRRVSAALGVPAEQLRSGVSASVPSNTKMVQIQYQASTPEAARAGAQGFAEAYLAFREALAADAQDRQAAELRSQVDQASKSLEQLAGKTGDFAAARRKVLVSRLVALQTSIGQLKATDVHPGVVSSPSETPTAPTGLDPSYLIAAGLLLGLAVGMVLAVGREASDDTVRRSAGASVAGLPVLSELRRRDTPIMIGSQVEEGVAEAYRRLRVGIPATMPGARTICISDTQKPGDTSVHALNLATMMSRTGSRVVLIDATPDEELVDLVRGRLSGIDGTGTGALLDVGGRDSLTVVTAGERIGQVTLVDEGRLARLVERHREAADYVLVAGSSLLTADGEVAGLAADCVLLLVEQTVTRARDVEKLEQRARVLGISFCGVFSVPGRRRSGRRRARRDVASRRSPEVPAAARMHRLGDGPIAQAGSDG